MNIFEKKKKDSLEFVIRNNETKLLLVDTDNDDEGMNFQKSFFSDIFEDQSFDVEDEYIDILRIYILIKSVKINARFELNIKESF